MLTNPQKSLISQAARAAKLSRPDYEAAWGSVTGWPDCVSSTDPRLTDRHVDLMMGYLEAIFEGDYIPANKRPHVFARAGYWAAKNRGGTTSRDRFTATAQADEIRNAEAALRATGYPEAKIGGIRHKTGGGWAYIAALRRTAAAEVKKQKAKGKSEVAAPPQSAVRNPRSAIQYDLTPARTYRRPARKYHVFDPPPRTTDNGPTS
jgi:hypothetical protein